MTTLPERHCPDSRCRLDAALALPQTTHGDVPSPIEVANRRGPPSAPRRGPSLNRAEFAAYRGVLLTAVGVALLEAERTRGFSVGLLVLTLPVLNAMTVGLVKSTSTFTSLARDNLAALPERARKVDRDIYRLYEWVRKTL